MWVGTKPKSLSGPPYPGLHSLGGHHGPATSGDPRRWPWQEQTQTVREADQGPPDLWARWPPCPRSSPAGKHGLDQETGGSLITFIGTAKLGDRANKLMAESRRLNISTGLKNRIAFASQNCSAWRRVKSILSKLSVLPIKKKKKVQSAPIICPRFCSKTSPPGKHLQPHWPHLVLSPEPGDAQMSALSLQKMESPGLQSPISA